MTPFTRATVLETAPERIERSILEGILEGRHPPGVRLPTLRELADVYSVNPSTMQRALARLEARGVVTSRQGSGVLVNDPLACGDAGLLPTWFSVAVIGDPSTAVEMVRDVLAVRRLFAVRLLDGIGPAVAGIIEEKVLPAVRAEGVTIDGLFELDMELTRMVVRSSGSSLLQLLINTIEQILWEVPQLRAATYGQPDRYAASLVRLADVLSSPPPSCPDVAGGGGRANPRRRRPGDRRTIRCPRGRHADRGPGGARPRHFHWSRVSRLPAVGRAGVGEAAPPLR